MYTLLLIEDNMKILDSNKEFLEAEGYAVHATSSLAEGRAVLRDKAVDLIILDIMLPDGSGIDFCSEIREHTDVPVLYLTCLDEGDALIDALAAGGDEYVTKPYSLDALSARVMALLRRNRIGKLSAGTFSLGPLFVDCGRRKMAMRNVDMALKPKEFDLLLVLVRGIERQFTAGELYKMVWAGEAIDVRTVVVHISSLRKKLENSPFYIATAQRKYYSLHME